MIWFQIEIQQYFIKNDKSSSNYIDFWKGGNQKVD